MNFGKNARVCVIGAGPSGITTIKHLIQAGIESITAYDKNDQVGGNWIYSPDPSHSSVYETSHIISSKKYSQYHDFPMPEDYPDYPDHELLLDYFQSYAKHFGVEKYIQFNTTVISAKMRSDYTWEVELDDGTTEIFDFVIAANGHHWNPRWPDIPGEFDGEYIHSHYYRTHLPYRNKRVLLIGAGNSACDIAVDIAGYADYTALSWRRGYWVIPKFLFGMPPDHLNAKLHFLPDFLRKWLFKITLRITVGKMEDYGLPKPDHSPTESHPILNSMLLHHLRHGDIHPKNEVVEFDGSLVVFEDGSKEAYDTVIAATGYKITFPFFEYPELDYSNKYVDLYLKIFHPDFPTLAIIGLTQPQGCIWPLSDTQAKLVANYIIGNYELPDDMEKRIEKEIKRIKNTYVDSIRHSTEVDYHNYLKKLRKQVPKSAPTWEN